MIAFSNLNPRIRFPGLSVGPAEWRVAPGAGEVSLFSPATRNPHDQQFHPYTPYGSPRRSVTGDAGETEKSKQR